MLSKITLSFALASILVLSACGKNGFATLGSSGDTANNGASGGVPPGGVTPDAYQQLQYKGTISGGNNDGTLVVDIDKTNGKLLLILPLQLNSYIESAQGQIPDLPGVTFMTYKDQGGASYIAVGVPLNLVLKGASFLNPARLPNGDPLPQIAGGELPSLGLTIPGKNNVKFYIYIGLDTVCLYVSSPFDPYLSLTFPIKNGLSTIGFMTSVPAKPSYDGGFFLSTQMPDEVARIIDDHFHF
jgi:hypothetical protein